MWQFLEEVYIGLIKTFLQLAPEQNDILFIYFIYFSYTAE